jgi:PAS domain S-box-containing protein
VIRVFRVLIVDDDESIREVLADVIGAAPDLETVGTARHAAEGIQVAHETQPDVAVVDARMNDGGGRHAIAGILEVAPGCAVLALSAYEERQTVLDMLLAGASGYVVKGTATSEIVEAVRRAARRQVSLSVDVLGDLLQRLVHDVADQRQSEAVLQRSAEQARDEVVLRRSEARFRELLESAPDAIVVAEEEGPIVLVNRRTEELFEHPREDIVGKPIEYLLPERFRNHVGHRSDLLGDPLTRPMGVGRRADGFEFPIDISFASLESPEGSLVIVFVRDMTQRERAFRELQDLEETLRKDEARRDLAERLVRAQEQERVRIAGDVHDDSVQVMTAALMRLQILRDKLQDPAHLALLTRLEETIQESLKRLRRLLFALHPRSLDTEGLVPTLRIYLQDLGHEASMSVRLQDQLAREPGPDVRAIVYRIAQEAVTNVMKHANANRLEVGLTTREGGVQLAVHDDGRGLTEDVVDVREGHIGLSTMRERAEMAGGWFRIETELDAGTSIIAWIPDSEGEGDVGAGPTETDARTGRPASV